MSPRRRRRLFFVCSILLGVGITIGLILYALTQNIDLFYTPSDIVRGSENGHNPKIGQRLRVGGMVVKGSVKRVSKSLDVTFDVTDIGETVTIHYNGILPDLFREGQGIVAQGVLSAPKQIDAFEVLAKHDENYMPPEVTDAMKKNHIMVNMPQR